MTNDDVFTNMSENQVNTTNSTDVIIGCRNITNLYHIINFMHGFKEMLNE